MLEMIENFLKTQDVEYKRHIPIANISPVKIGGPANLFVAPKTEKSFVDIIRCLEKQKIKHIIVGRMTNILPSDKGYDGVIVSTSYLKGYRLSDRHLYVQCGVMLPSIAHTLATYEVYGFEELYGIPGSVGGLAIMNAGAYGKEISDVIEGVTVYDPQNDRVQYLRRDEIEFSYRHSSLVGKTICSMVLGFSRASTDRIIERIAKFRDLRHQSQPLGFPTLGSVFKRPMCGYAAKMIDECGLKGRRVGGAEISSKHAGFIINRGGATASDFLSLMHIAKQSVLSRFGVSLEPEIVVM